MMNMVDAPTMERFLQEMAKEKPVRFTAQQLCTFTTNYSTKLGSGGFSVVYKGQFPNVVKIAVKIEMVGRRRNTIVGSSDSMDWFPKRVWDEYEKWELSAAALGCEIEDKDREKAERMCKVALWCVQDSPESGPPMSAVVKMLEGGVEILPPPKPFHYLYSVVVDHVVEPSDTSDGSTNSCRYKDTTPIMAKYKIQVASV